MCNTLFSTGYSWLYSTELISSTSQNVNAVIWLVVSHKYSRHSCNNRMVSSVSNPNWFHITVNSQTVHHDNAIIFAKCQNQIWDSSFSWVFPLLLHEHVYHNHLLPLDFMGLYSSNSELNNILSFLSGWSFLKGKELFLFHANHGYKRYELFRCSHAKYRICLSKDFMSM